MMKTVLALVATLGLLIQTAPAADACGVKLTLRAPKVRQHAARSSNPSQILLLGSPPKRLASDLSDAGHSVEVVSDPGQAKRKKYRVIIADSDMQDEAKQRFPGAVVLARSGSTHENVRRVESSLTRRPINDVRRPDRTLVAKKPIRTGPELNDGKDRVAAGTGTSSDTADTTTTGADTTATDTTDTTDTTATDVVATNDKPDRVKPDRVKPDRVKPDRVKPDDTDVAPADKPVKTAKFTAEMGFGGGSATLSARVKSRLNNDAKWLAANPDKSITVEGHASQVGSAEVNQALSEERANAVKDYLVEQGVDGSRIQVIGYGFDRPAYEPASSGRNRRVKIVVNE
jgi:outer membrane protein OmpA-like peptidoglycan-associated protein